MSSAWPGLYLVGAWLIMQVGGTVLPMFGAPDWVPRSIVIVLALGFVPALVFAWVFELTPDGIKRDAEVAPDQSIAPQTARRMDRMIIAVLLLALVFFGFDRFVLAPRRDAALVATTTQAVQAKATAQSTPDISRKSIAVLPFVNMSGEAANEYFSDGISEEILNVLAGAPGAAGGRAHVVVRVQGQDDGSAGDRPRRCRCAWCSKAACASRATRCASPRS